MKPSRTLQTQPTCLKIVAVDAMRSKRITQLSLTQILTYRHASLIKWVVFYAPRIGVVNITTMPGKVPHIKWSVMKSETHWVGFNLKETTSQQSYKIFSSGPSQPLLAGWRQAASSRGHMVLIHTKTWVYILALPCASWYDPEQVALSLRTSVPERR